MIFILSESATEIVFLRDGYVEAGHRCPHGHTYSGRTPFDPKVSFNDALAVHVRGVVAHNAAGCKKECSADPKKRGLPWEDYSADIHILERTQA